MKFIETPVQGAFIIEIDPIEDNRGFFARTWCSSEFKSRGINDNLAQCNLSYNLKKGTVRGMHLQREPYQEAKLVRCTRGAIYDVVLDLRLSSSTYKKWHSVELTDENHRMLYIPEGCAHGFQSLEDRSEVFYQMSTPYNATAAYGWRWDDPAFQILWPLSDYIISEKDQSYPNFPA